MTMIQKLRWKFVLINMLIVAALLSCICGFMIVTTQDSLRQDSLALLNRVIAQDGRSDWPYASDKGDRYFLYEDIFGGFFSFFGDVEKEDITLPYFTVTVGLNGTAIITDSQFYDLSDQEALTDIVQDCLLQPSDSGVLEQYHLRYLRNNEVLGWRLAFSDISQERSTLRQMMVNLLFMAALALVAFFFISHLLARWAVRPVERAWKQQRQFVADASHELKTPLTVVLSNVEMLQNYSDHLLERDQRWLGNIRASAQQMQELVEEMLTLARSDSMSASDGVRELVNLSDLTMEAVLLFEPLVFEAGKQLEDDVDEDLYVSGDPARLKRLVEILLDNARKYAAEHGVITLSLKPEGNRRVCLTVFNEGTPLTKEQLEHIFERFYRGDKARTTEGFGLGLSIAQRTVQDHHGTIRAESDDRGNRFLVSLPREKSGES